MWRFKPSKFKNAAAKVPRKPEGWVTDVSVGSQQSYGNHIQASAAFMAFNVDTGGVGCLCVLHLNDSGSKRDSCHHLRAHAGFITDFAFCPYDDGVLATGSQDRHVKLWRIPYDPDNLKLPDNTIADILLDDGVEILRFNPAVDSLLSIASNKKIQLFDVNASKEREDFSHEDIVQGLSWKANGQLLASCGRDKKLKIWDLRNPVESQITNGHSNNRDGRVLWLGNSDYVLSTGFGAGREREVFVRDVRKFNEPIFTYSSDSSLGVLIPFFDADTNMLFLVAKADTAVSFWELTEQEPFFYEVSKFMGAVQAKGATLVPKRGLDVMKGEVNRVLVLGTDCVAPVSYVIPRKSYREFHCDIFPDTPSPEPIMTVDEWINGEKNAKKDVICLNPSLRGNKPYFKFNHVFGVKSLLKHNKQEDNISLGIEQKLTELSAQNVIQNLGVNDLDKSKARSTQKPAITPKPMIPYKTDGGKLAKSSEIMLSHNTGNVQTSIIDSHQHNRTRPTIAFGMRVSRFRHLNGFLLAKETNVTDINSLTRTIPGESDGFHVNQDYMALPLGVGGGFIAILPLNTQGRALAVADMPGVICGTKCLDFTWDPFNSHRLITVCDTGEIQAWDIEEEHLVQKVSKPSFNLRPLSDKVSIVKFHPCATDILCVAGSDMLIRIWNLGSKKVEYCLEGHSDQILALSWSPNGQLLASVSKDQKIRLFDPRLSSQPIKEGQGPEGVRSARIVWVMNGTHLVLSGFDKVSQRQVYLYSATDITLPLGNIGLDVSPATLVPHYDEDSSTLFLTGKGDATIYAFEVAMDAPYFHPLSHYKCSGPHQSVSFLPKIVCHVKEVEFSRAVRLLTSSIETLSFRVPRVRTEYFQDDIFPDTRVVWKPSMTAAEWLAGENKKMTYISLKPSDMTLLSDAPAIVKGTSNQKSAPESLPLVFDGDVMLESSMGFLQVSKEKEKQIVEAMMSQCQYQENSLPQDSFDGVDPEEWDEEEIKHVEKYR